MSQCGIEKMPAYSAIVESGGGTTFST